MDLLFDFQGMDDRKIFSDKGTVEGLKNWLTMRLQRVGIKQPNVRVSVVDDPVEVGPVNDNPDDDIRGPVVTKTIAKGKIEFDGTLDDVQTRELIGFVQDYICVWRLGVPQVPVTVEES